MVPTLSRMRAGVAKGFPRLKRKSAGKRWPRSHTVLQEAGCFDMDVGRAGCCPSGGLSAA